MSTKLVRLYYKKRKDFYYWKRAALNSMGFYTYCVITSVPDNAKENGNLCTATFAMDGYPDSDLYLVNDTYQFRNGKEVKADRTPYPLTYDDMNKILKGKKNFRELDFRVPVFTLGEIVILNEPDGREIDGKERAPRKWSIEYEEFTSIRKAAKRARQVLDEQYRKDQDA